MADAGVSGTEMQRDLVPVDEFPIGVLSRCPQDKSNHFGCSSCRGDGLVQPMSWKSSNRPDDIFDSKKQNRLARRAVTIF